MYGDTITRLPAAGGLTLGCVGAGCHSTEVVTVGTLVALVTVGWLAYRRIRQWRGERSTR